MIDFKPFLEQLANHPDIPELLVSSLQSQIATALSPQANREIPEWNNILQNLPVCKPSLIKLNSDVVTIGSPEDLSSKNQILLEKQLRKLHPWRKGPFNLFGIFIDTEWRSDLKWNRLKDHIQSLEDRLVLDVGCGNGYHCLRMRGEGAHLVVGIDPYLKYVYQFAALQTYLNDANVQVLPSGIQHLPPGLQCFDTVFSMGVLYHRRSPFDHLFELRNLLRPGGELVLETLVIEGKKGEVLVPEGRYAKMRNVWFIPTPATLETWLRRAGFKEIRLIDVSLTTFEEQRPTSWMTFESLPDFLDSDNPQLTIEGYPRPRRAIFVANKPS